LLAKEVGASTDGIRRWVKAYQERGEEGLRNPVRSSGRRRRLPGPVRKKMQRGWTSCPTKSLNAHEIETAVVDYLRSIGRKREITAANADERDLVNALFVFDPVWDSLPPREQSRIIRLLLERITYDGRDGKVTVTFHSPGIKALCMEPGLKGQEKKQ
jgi:hypothetical protein